MARAIKTLEKNPNKHTEYGGKLLEDSYRQNGYTEPMVAAADGTLLSGNARAEAAADVFAGVEPIYVETDGTRPIVHVRTDIANAEEAVAQRIILASNRIGQVDYAPDNTVILEMLQAQIDAGETLEGTGFSEADLDTLLKSGETGFTPNVQPMIGAVTVTEEDVANEAGKLEDQFQGQQQYAEVTCPHCGEKFFIDKGDVK
jgi:hypothetical protein